MKLDQIIDSLIEREGPYVNNADDPGRATKYGITEAVARRQGYTGDMRDLPESLAKEIYIDIYWTETHYNRVAELSMKVAEELLDTGVNCGVGVASRFFQRCLNVFNLRNEYYPMIVVDGLIGPRTLAAFESYLQRRDVRGELVLLRALNSLQGARYVELAESNPDLETFVYGWFNHRVEIK